MPKHKTWFRMARRNEDAEIVIYDEIGFFGINAKDFRDDLLALGNFEKLTLRINSPGGEVFAGWAIYNMLDRLDAEITVYIDGLAASMASLIAMVGDTIIMPENSMMMIHDPSGFVMGTADDMRDVAEVLERMKASMVSAYARKSGLPSDEVSQIMSAETWYTATEAVEAGFADEVEEAVRAAATFDLSRFQNPPNARTSRKARSQRMNPTPVATATAPVAPAPAPVAPAPAPAPAAPVAETVEQITARVTAEITARNQEIAALCTIAGKPDRAAAFIAAGQTVAQVTATLQAEALAGGRSPTAPAPAAPVVTAAHQPQLQPQGQGQQQEDLSDLIKTPDHGKIWANYNRNKAGAKFAERRNRAA